MPVSSAADKLSFTLTADADVFIAVGTSLRLPEWLKDYKDTKMNIRNSGPRNFRLYRKRYTANSTVMLKENDATISSDDEQIPFHRRGPGGGIIVTPVTTLQPPFDQKATTSYKMDQVVTADEGTARQTVNKRDAVVFTKPAGGQVDVTINTGVGDVYSITIRYYSPAAETKKASWQLIAADGTVMKTEPMEFTTTREGKWNYFTTTNGSMIKCR
jgi:beta-galactosidase